MTPCGNASLFCLCPTGHLCPESLASLVKHAHGVGFYANKRSLGEGHRGPSPSPSDDARSRGPADRWGARASQTAFAQTPPHVQRGSSRVLADSDNLRGDPMPCFGGRLVWPVAHGARPSSSRSVRGPWSLGPKALMKGTEKTRERQGKRSSGRGSRPPEDRLSALPDLLVLFQQYVRGPQA